MVHSLVISKSYSLDFNPSSNRSNRSPSKNSWLPLASRRGHLKERKSHGLQPKTSYRLRKLELASWVLVVKRQVVTLLSLLPHWMIRAIYKSWQLEPDSRKLTVRRLQSLWRNHARFNSKRCSWQTFAYQMRLSIRLQDSSRASR